MYSRYLCLACKQLFFVPNIFLRYEGINKVECPHCGSKKFAAKPIEHELALPTCMIINEPPRRTATEEQILYGRNSPAITITKIKKLMDMFTEGRLKAIEKATPIILLHPLVMRDLARGNKGRKIRRLLKQEKRRQAKIK